MHLIELLAMELLVSKSVHELITFGLLANARAFESNFGILYILISFTGAPCIMLLICLHLKHLLLFINWK